MMKSRLTITNIILIAVVTIAAIIAMVAVFTPAQAAITDNVFGQAWGASGPSANAPAQSVGGIGWVSMNDCTSPSPSSCSGASFGVNVDQSGVFSGQAWSSNYGWIDFGLTHPNQLCGTPASVNLSAVASNGSAPITGFAHVYSAGAGDDYWDGCISMSGTDHEVRLYDTGSITGAAWGANVVGWVSFDAVYMIALGCTDSTATNYDPTAVIDDGSCNLPPTGLCMNVPWSTPLGATITINSQNDLDAYNNSINSTDPVMVYDSSTGLCLEKGDVCPSNLNASAPVPYWNGIQTQAWVDNYNANNNPNIIIAGGYCVLQGLIPMCNQNPAFNPLINSHNSTLCTIGPPGDPTIPIFEEI